MLLCGFGQHYIRSLLFIRHYSHKEFHPIDCYIPVILILRTRFLPIINFVGRYSRKAQYDECVFAFVKDIIRRTVLVKGITTNLKPIKWQDWCDKRVRLTLAANKCALSALSFIKGFKLINKPRLKRWLKQSKINLTQEYPRKK